MNRKGIVCLLACLILIASTVGCATRPFEDWSRADTIRQGIYTAGHLADWAQTKEIASNPRFVELNPIMGENPSQGTVDLYMASSMIVMLLIPAMLSPKYRAMFQEWACIVKFAVVAHNYDVGVRF